ncbi:hypothetical protein [Chondromyces apiculatus]|uniref:Uncharacterized protein n=1 Tax=Chondromyces apiculatus DSM 436 TaxID=1192034 RepID=A0A017TCW2_9BACT|nr:hypothetical protein [Chondromyces apiculatus]EYF07044.1 Hypothetical protein CAP_1303 [Chondromyces apiculatus DSM 436]
MKVYFADVRDHGPVLAVTNELSEEVRGIGGSVFLGDRRGAGFVISARDADELGEQLTRWKREREARREGSRSSRCQCQWEAGDSPCSLHDEGGT